MARDEYTSQGIEMVGETDVDPLLSSDPSVASDRLFMPLYSTSYSCNRSWASTLMFSWIHPLLEKRRRSEELKLDDTLHLPSELTAVVISEKFERAWRNTVRRGHPSISAAFHALFARDFWMAGLFRLVTETCKVGSPMIVREVILYVKGESTIVPPTTLGGLGLAFFLFLVVLLQACTLQHFIHGVFVVGAGINTAAAAAVYNKSLRLGRASLDGSRLGQTLNFQTKDASKLREVVVFFHNLWAAPLTAIGCTALLLYVLGPSSLVGVCAIPVLIPLESWVAQRSQAYRKNVLKVADARISLVGEVIDGIKTVKLNSMSKMFQTRVGLLREKELASIRHALTLNACNQAVMRSSPIIVALATFAAFVLSGNKLDAQTAFTALALFNTIAHPFHVMPKAIQLYADAKVSLQRLQNFLLEDETQREKYYTLCGRGEDRNVTPRVVINDAAFAPIGGSTLLEHVTVEMRRGVSLVVGPTGSGKTTFLLGLVERLSPESDDGSVRIETTDGRVALCPDMPWIVNASARDNISLGSLGDFDEGRYRSCVHHCALERDFASWPDGDSTVIGAKGITISGGQKTRIALARAIYSGCSMVLLDDPLSALDNIVGSWVFRHAICKMAEGAAIVMSTHQQQYVKEDCDLFVIDRRTLRARTDRRSVLEAGVLSIEGEKNFEKHAGYDAGASGSRSNFVDVESWSTPPVHKAKPDEVKSMLKLSAQVDHDRIKEGVPANVYLSYLKACGIMVVIVTLSISVLAQVMDVSKEVVLAFWSDSSSTKPGVYLCWYAGVCMLVVVINCVRFFAMCWLGLRSSEALHKSLLHRVMGAPLQFFQVTESGRITSRFSSDFDTIDMAIPTALASFMDAFLALLGAVGVVVGTSPCFFFFIVPIAIAYHRIQLTYRLSAKELKRLDSATKSPIYSHFQETLDGLLSIQAYGIAIKMREKNFFLIDANARSRLTWDATNRWLGIRLDFLGALVVFLATLTAVLVGRSSPGIVGLGLSYALAITRTLSFGVRSSTALENHFNSVERVQQFISLEQEQENETPEGDVQVADVWSPKEIVMQDVCARYRPDLPLVLNGVSLSVRCGERVGICGRSGSGKSSLALALVRVVECCQGRIFVGGRDIKEIPLSLLRSGVTVISQDSHVFSGSVRDVVDPLGQCSDAHMWEILEMTGLKSAVAGLPLGLLSHVSEHGSNWSAGQRQLLCISRAMVNQPGVLVFDEATANVDNDTDANIQRLIRSFLSNAAVIVIAHRLEDVISCNRVLVMDAGRVAEEGTPSHLLGDKNGMFSNLVRELGSKLEGTLRQEHIS